ncbi:Fur family transcriptional regulator [Streptomyces sioyaensis]|uniref:Fur family transcriptional regulator n=1 Tax=Streptomyces sioyaensis TaxID=67364 RepID=UPI0037CD6BC3
MLSALDEAGRADIVRDMRGERLFRYRPGSDHRHYLICTECGVSVTLDSMTVENWAAGVARTGGFTAVRHTVELTSICPDCSPSAESSPRDQRDPGSAAARRDGRSPGQNGTAAGDRTTWSRTAAAPSPGHS